MSAPNLKALATPIHLVDTWVQGQGYRDWVIVQILTWGNPSSPALEI